MQRRIRSGASTESASSFGGGFFECLSKSPTRSDIPTAALYPQIQEWLRGLNRIQIGGVAEYLWENNSVVSYTIGQTVHYAAPVIPVADSIDPEWNRMMNTLWESECDTFDFTGRFKFEALEEQISRQIDIHGDVGVLATSMAGFFQIQIIDGPRIGDPMGQKPGNNDGVWVDEFGRVTGYDVWTGKGFEFIPKSEMILVSDSGLNKNYRELSPLRRGTNDVRDMTDIKAMLKNATKIQSSMHAVLEGDGALERDVWGDDSGPDGTAASLSPTATEFEKNLTIAEVTEGELKELPDGKKLAQLDPKNPAPNVVDFLSVLAAHFVMSLDTPAAFIQDDRLTGPNQRSVNDKAKRKFASRASTISTFAKWVWVRWAADKIARGVVSAPVGWDNPQFRYPPEISIDAARDAQQDREDIKMGIKSRRRVMAKGGEDWKSETDQSIAEETYILKQLKQQSIDTDVPFEELRARWGYVPAPPKPDPNADAKNTDTQKK